MNNRGVFWGVFLVLLGIVYLLRQFGLIYFHITWLFAWRLWPVLLIIAGLRLILPRSSNIAGSLILLVMVALFAYVIIEGYQMKKEGKGFGNSNWNSPGIGDGGSSGKGTDGGTDDDGTDNDDKPGADDKPDTDDKPTTRISFRITLMSTYIGVNRCFNTNLLTGATWI